MIDPQTTHQPKEPPTMTIYKQKAEEVARRIATQWNDAGRDDPRGLTDAVHHALVQEANLELRQVLTQMSGQLEMGLRNAEQGRHTFTPEKMRRLIEGLDRAHALMEVFLDRASASKLTITIDREVFDLSDALTTYTAAHGLSDKVRLALDPETKVLGDRHKLMDAITHLVTRFYFAARPHEEPVVFLNVRDGHVEGFVGLSPSHLRAEQLMEEMTSPFDIEDIGIDIAYARAVLERHDGSLFVATAGDAMVGFGFTLPFPDAIVAQGVSS